MITLEPLTSKQKIDKPRVDYHSEFEVQAFIWWNLTAAGIDCRGEVLHQRSIDRPSRRERCRFDLVIFDGEIATRIIEVKSAKIKHRNGLESTRQSIRYRDYGVPVTFVYGMEDAQSLIDELLAEIHRV